MLDLQRLHEGITEQQHLRRRVHPARRADPVPPWSVRIVTVRSPVLIEAVTSGRRR
jgi:hypothetical protein